jgi:hypothetical protein
VTRPDGNSLGEETPEADLAEQSIAVEDTDDDTWREAARVTSARDWDANEADLIEQAIQVPDDDRDFDR